MVCVAPGPGSELKITVTSMAVTGTKVSLKIFIDKEQSRFLFAEANSDFVDVLFSFLTLPLGTIVRLIGKTQSTLGCFSALYQSVAGIGSEHFFPEGFRDLLLHPRSSSEDHCRRLKVNIDETVAKYFVDDAQYIYKGNVFFRQHLKFIITDDLQVTPVLPGAVIGLLKSLCITDVNVIEERTVELGIYEFSELLKCTLFSTTPLSSLFYFKEVVPCRSELKKQSIPIQKGHFVGDKKINVKVVLNKSSKAFLFAEAGKDFMDLLFNFLVIPLGEMLHILDRRSCLGCIDGLYKSLLSLDSHYFISQDHKNILLRPKPLFTAFNLLPPGSTMNLQDRSVSMGDLSRVGFMRKDAVFFVLDDLEVSPYSPSFAISVYKRFQVPISDLEERELSLGVAECVSILRASLDSTSAISGGLLHNSLIFKEPKQEKLQ